MYKVTFADNTIFEGGTPVNSLWSDLPNKPIQSIEYWVTDLHFLFENFEEYNHCVERIKGVNTPLETVTKAIIMGRVAQRVYQVVFDLKTGNTWQLVTVYGEEYSPQERFDLKGDFAGWKNGKSLSGWKQGLVGESPKLRKIDLDLKE